MHLYLELQYVPRIGKYGIYSFDIAFGHLATMEREAFARYVRGARKRVGFAQISLTMAIRCSGRLRRENPVYSLNTFDNQFLWLCIDNSAALAISHTHGLAHAHGTRSHPNIMGENIEITLFGRTTSRFVFH